MIFALANLGVAIGAFLMIAIIKLRENIEEAKREYEEENGIKLYRLKRFNNSKKQ